MHNLAKVCTLWMALLSFSMALVGCQKEASDTKVYRIGIISGFGPFVAIADGFRKKMAELGYVEGENIVYEFRSVNPETEADKQIVRDLIRQKVDLLLTYPTEASLWTKQLAQSSNIPIVFTMTGTEGNDLVESIPQPGGNVTGVRYPGPDVIAKRFELIHELLPDLRNVWTAYDINYPTNRAAIEMLRETISKTDVSLKEAVITSVSEIKENLQTLTESNEKINAIVMMPDAISQSDSGWAVITSFADANKIPIVGTEGKKFNSKLAMAYAPNIMEMGQHAAPLADKILKGTPAGNIMVVTAPSHLMLNYKYIQILGLKVPQGLLSRADVLIR